MQQWARFAILGAMFVVAYLLILAWQKDYGHVETKPQQQAAVVSHDVSADLPNGQTATTDVKDEMNAFDFGIGLGLGYNFTPNLNMNARYTAGITDVAKNNSGDAVRNNVFQLGLGYTFK